MNAEGLLAFIVFEECSIHENVRSKNETNRIGTKNQQALDANHSNSVPHWQKASRIHYEAVSFFYC